METPFDTPHYAWFWSVIERIRTAPESTEAVFQGMSVEQLEEFYDIYRAVSVELYPEYCDEERGWDEEDIARASDWVVNQGMTFYHAVSNDHSLFPTPKEFRSVPYRALRLKSTIVARVGSSTTEVPEAKPSAGQCRLARRKPLWMRQLDCWQRWCGSTPTATRPRAPS